MLARYRRINVPSSWGGEEARDEMDTLIITFGYAVFAMGRVDSSHMHHKLSTAARDNIQHGQEASLHPRHGRQLRECVARNLRGHFGRRDRLQ